jgi:ribosomal protein S18 acetylase RimI-like enzyme
MHDRPTPIIRAARREEIPELSALIVAALLQFYRAVPHHILAPYIESSRDIGSQWERGEVTVLEIGGEIAGAGVYYASAAEEGMGLPPHWASMRTLVVHPEARGQGFGQLLVEHFVERAGRDRRPTLALHTADYMEHAVRIYRKMGFLRCPEYDILASSFLGADPSGGDVLITAYRLQLLRG